MILLIFREYKLQTFFIMCQLITCNVEYQRSSSEKIFKIKFCALCSVFFGSGGVTLNMSSSKFKTEFYFNYLWNNTGDCV